MFLIRRLSLSVFFSTMASANAYATLDAIIPVPNAVAKADVIVVGHESISPLSPGTTLHDIITVDRIIKGVFANKAIIDLGLASDGLTHISPNYRMFFLKNDNGHLTLNNEIYDAFGESNGQLIASPFLEIPPAIGAPPLDLVANELANVFLLTEQQAIDKNLGVTIPVTSTSEIVGFNSDGTAIGKIGSPTDQHQAEFTYTRALNALDTIPYPRRKQVLVTVIGLKHPGVGKIFALASMIAGQDISLAIQHEDELINLPPQDQGAGIALEVALDSFIPSNDTSFVPNDETILFFSNLGKAKNLEVRKGAFYVLKMIDTTAAIQALDNLLNESNLDFRTEIVGYVCFKTKNCDPHEKKVLAQPENISRVRQALQSWVSAQEKS